MTHLSIPEIPNVSLVAFYGAKPHDLESIIVSLQQSILGSKHRTGKFDVYDAGQVHATILGCEGLRTSQGILNKWFREKRNKHRYIDLINFLKYARTGGPLPITIRIGGFKREDDYGFTSRDQHPYERTFQFQKENDSHIAVLMGWPCRGPRFPLDLDRFRLGAQNFNLLHKFHARLDSVDNDFYLRLGVLREVTSEEGLRIIEGEIREFLRNQPPIYVSVENDHLAFAGYEELTLKTETTQIIPLRFATKENLEQLYPCI